jgi:hypothetical protein
LLAQTLRQGDIVMIDTRDIFAATQAERAIGIARSPLIMFERKHTDA